MNDSKIIEFPKDYKSSANPCPLNHMWNEMLDGMFLVFTKYHEELWIHHPSDIDLISTISSYVLCNLILNLYGDESLEDKLGALDSSMRIIHRTTADFIRQMDRSNVVSMDGDEGPF